MHPHIGGVVAALKQFLIGVLLSWSYNVRLSVSRRHTMEAGAVLADSRLGKADPASNGPELEEYE